MPLPTGGIFRMSSYPVPDRTDIELLNALQGDIPLVVRPYLKIGERLGISEQEILERITRLMDCGIIRGISPVIESSKVGFTAATLIALHVPPARIREVAAIISGYPEVSHNFQRDHHYQIWFTLSGRDPAHVGQIVSEIMERTGIGRDDLLDLPTVKRLKVDVRFSIPNLESEEGSCGPV